MLPHQHLPPPFNAWVARYILLQEFPHADFTLAAICVFLTVLAFIQVKAFARPPPVPLKKLPKRPLLSILFKPDDAIPVTNTTQKRDSAMSAAMGVAATMDALPHPVRLGVSRSISVESSNQQSRSVGENETNFDSAPGQHHVVDSTTSSFSPNNDEVSDSDNNDQHSTTRPPPETPVTHSFDLPDSFAPLLSSSVMEILTGQLTADLIHATQATAGIRMRYGRHEIPLNKDVTRPQLIFDVPSSGCRLSAMVQVGSDGFTMAEDLDVNQPTGKRSKPMVKHAQVLIDPPLPLLNVAPTLIHFPTLFEDKYVLPQLRRIQLIRYFFDFIISISSLIEKLLWILESQLQIHLGKIEIIPIYKGSSDEKQPVWRLQFAFSGHVLFLGWIPIPFISVRLPTFIIPQPHSLLEHLLTNQPLASARLRRERLAEDRLVLAILHTAETWNMDVQAVLTPPAVGVDLNLPGGVAVAVELALGRDPTRSHSTDEQGGGGAHPVGSMSQHSFQHHSGPSFPPTSSKSGTFPTHPLSPTHPVQPMSFRGDDESINSMSSWTTRGSGSHVKSRRYQINPFDANALMPWSVVFVAKGSISHDKCSVHIKKLEAVHVNKSHLGARGSLAVWRARSQKPPSGAGPTTLPLRKMHRRSGSHPELVAGEETPSIAAILMFPNETTSFDNDCRMLEYDYVFDVDEMSRLDAITVSIGASHPFLQGGTMVTTILDNIYAHGSFSARENAVLDPDEMNRKRNILRHLPATDFHFGIQNISIPAESNSYSDDGQTLYVPELERGRMRVHLLGGIEPSSEERSHSSTHSGVEAVGDGVQLIADFEAPSLLMRTDGLVKEFPELDIFEGVRLRTNLHGIISGSVRAHLRPQKMVSVVSSTTGPNIFNPLEAYEIDFSRSNLSVKMKEYTVSLGHRRVIFPSESTFVVSVIESIVDMGFEGKTQCQLVWDFQGLSPILQVSPLGQSPEDADPENKQQVSILIAPLRQGRVSFHVSSVGGISFNKAATSREDKEGLYDWKFFNALVSPDQESPGRILDVLHDKRTMEKLLQVVKFISEDLHVILHNMLRQIWRAKDIFDKEGVSDPKHAIPMYNMSRLLCLFLTGDVAEVDEILPIVSRVVEGEGLDVVKVKELLRNHIEQYDDWAPEMDRLVRWASVALGPSAVSQPFVEEDVLPLVEQPIHLAKFEDIPSAAYLYDVLLDKPHLPLEPDFSALLGRVAPYLNFRQIEFILQARASTDWQPSDLRRIRYVYSIKKKVLEIAESYGGLSFLPQSFLVSVFLGEATRSSHRFIEKPPRDHQKALLRAKGSFGGSSQIRSRSNSSVSYSQLGSTKKRPTRSSIFSRLRRKQVESPDSRLELVVESEEEALLAQTEVVASASDPFEEEENPIPGTLLLVANGGSVSTRSESYQLGDSLLGPQDVAILLQAGLTSVMKSSTVVQLNQRMLLDLICSQPRSFAVAVLAEIGTLSGQVAARGLSSALMSLLELDQTSFKANHKIDMHGLLESWLPGLKIPRRDDYMAGGRWARQSYYEALITVANSILDDAETYIAVKEHIQRVRRSRNSDPLPLPRSEREDSDESDSVPHERGGSTSKLLKAVEAAKASILQADQHGFSIIGALISDEESAKQTEVYIKAISLYQEAFSACSQLLLLDKHAFYADWFHRFYKRNYDALMIKSMLDNAVANIDNTRHWLNALRIGAKGLAKSQESRTESGEDDEWEEVDDLFLQADKKSEQMLIDAILDATIYDPSTREELRSDPLVRLLIPNPPGKYDFVVISAMGVITEGKRGLELQDAFQRLRDERGVTVIRADTATVRSLEYNANKIIEAIEVAVETKKPYGLLGYSQGCANILMAESMLLSGSPKQQQLLSRSNGGLVCRQLLFSAANGSFHGPAMDKKIQRLIVMTEEFFKYQQGYVSRALSSIVLETLTSILDSSHFHKLIGGAQSFLPDGCRAFWREAQHCADVPTCTLKGVLEKHTTPECLEMLSNLLTKQSGSPLHDSQVHVFDAVGYPVYYHNRNGRILQKCAIGEGAIQRTHHWSPLSDEVEFVRTSKDLELASFDCAKDRHVFPWVDVNARFGFIKYIKEDNKGDKSKLSDDRHPLKLLSERNGAAPKGDLVAASNDSKDD